MSDLISRSALDSFFYSETSGTDEIIEDAVMKYSEMEMEFSDDCRALCKDIIEMCRNVIRTEPTVEAKTVVHCKDCEHWGTGVAGETEHVKCCEYGKYMVGENGFCCYADMRGGENE